MRASLIVLAAMAALVAPGCEGECKPVSVEASSKVVGAYECEQTASLESCYGISICEGKTTIQISRGDSGEWIVGKTDCNGSYYELGQSQVCEPPAEQAGSYTIIATHESTEASANPRVMYSLHLTARESGGANGGPSVDGSLTMTVMPNGGDSCTLMGSIDDCVSLY